MTTQPSAFSYFTTSGTSQYVAVDWFGAALYITRTSGITVANLRYNSTSGNLYTHPPP